MTDVVTRAVLRLSAVRMTAGSGVLTARNPPRAFKISAASLAAMSANVVMTAAEVLAVTVTQANSV